MPKKTPTTGKSAPNVAIDPVNFDATGFAETGQKSLLAMAHLHARLMCNALEVNAELLDFARRRIGEEMSASGRLSRARTTAEASEVMSGFCQKALKDYAEEAERIIKIGTDVTLRSVEEIQAETDEVLRNRSKGVALPE